ncbi:DUF362 domain-containing protein [Desulfoluna spongiiphila]|uniref:DUF362 domain-containing protein n=1 Tax=Desulfoluna spongiiphila TaxID=419481 RepID=UPI00125295DA|nr:DUF362 domain-containing protein [Desulfoluna spongiiphila]VVS93214.1 domain of unknown function duf362 [Desulfoluna spongiiphila]
MASTVYHIDLRATFQESLPEKIGRLVETAGLDTVCTDRELTAVKIHFGEKGNTAFINPVFVRKIIDKIKETGASPFLTDTNTLYAGTRSDTPSHLTTAVENGFAYSVVGAPVIIADGLRGRSDEEVPVNGKHVETAYVGADIHHADALVVLSHFKGHELSGFGGALKNLGMGCASRRGKLAQHSTVSPKVKRKKCIGCGMCTTHCPVDAITLEATDGKKKASINPETCIGCGDCIIVCPTGAVQIQWNQSVPSFLEIMMEYAKAALAGKEGKTLFVSFITDVSPLCDCIGHSDVPIVPNIGILASTDPVAIDQACVDLVNAQPANPGSCLKTNTAPGEDKFKGLHPHVDWPLQLAHAEELGLGSRDYELVKLESKGLKLKG